MVQLYDGGEVLKLLVEIQPRICARLEPAEIVWQSTFRSLPHTIPPHQFP
jgi:hypothetical protein